MRKEVFLAGLGGQGIISTGILIAAAAGRYEQKYVAQSQSYGPEARGGACKAEVVISEEEIDYVKTLHPDIFIAMSQQGLDTYIPRIDPKIGIVIVDASLVESVPSVYENVYRIEATGIAEEKLGARIVANVVMLGAFSRITNYVKPENLKKAICDTIQSKFISLNTVAFDEGYQLADKLM